MRLITIVLVLTTTLSFAQPGYYKAQMHCHSTNSDGGLTPDELAQNYADLGFKILFITDHYSVTESDSVSCPDMLCINGQELSLAKHFNGFFLNRTINTSGFSNQQALDSIHGQGGLAALNHPVALGFPDTTVSYRVYAQEIIGMEHLNFIEIYNTLGEIYDPDNLMLWDSVLSAGKNVYGIAVDDLHQPIEAFQRGYVMIKLDTLTEANVYTALENGDFYASSGIEISKYEVHEDSIYIQCKNCTSIKFVGENQTTLNTVMDTIASYTITNELYVRVELADDGIGFNQKKAWTQPVFYTPNSIKEVKDNEHELTVFPNPVEDEITIVTRKTQQGVIYIYNAQGQLQLQQLAGETVTKIDFSGLAKGLYTIKYEAPDYTVTEKVIK